jgi:hypothetical protein
MARRASSHAQAPNRQHRRDIRSDSGATDERNRDMSQAARASAPQSPTPGETCAQCSKTLTDGDRVAAGDRHFCRSCYASLRAELEQAVTAMSADIPYARAATGAVLGGAAGALVWWGFTVLTHISFGLVAVAIGFLVGFGTIYFAGGKRSAGLQGLSIAVALLSFCCATYLVNMTFINKALAESGNAFRVGFPPTNPALAFRVLSADFGIMDFVFLAIVIYEAWKIPKPLALPPQSA